MKHRKFFAPRLVALACISASALLVPTLVQAQAWKVQAWKVQVGVQTEDKAIQVLAYLPNEIWIHTGDSIEWTVATDEPHTVTFLTAGQVRPPYTVGCPGNAPSGANEDGSGCVNSGVLANGQGYSVTFPKPGNYKLVCLVHANMTSVVHVLDWSVPLPHYQDFYDDLAADAKKGLASSSEHAMHPEDDSSALSVSAGKGEIVATGGGSNTVSVMRFMHPDEVVHVGETVEWTNSDPVTPHTITFGAEPANTMPPSANVTVDPDGARHATISSPSDIVHSGFISASPQDRVGLAQTPAGVTRFRVTFTKAGVFQYKCVLHDNLGMLGEVTVQP
jgi:plastocyanin